MNDMMLAKIESMMKDETFYDQLQELSSKDEIIELFSHNGIEISNEDFAEMADKGIAILKELGHIGEDGELSPEMLDAVSGGGKIGTLLLLGGLGFASACIGYPEGTVICIIAGVAVMAT